MTLDVEAEPSLVIYAIALVATLFILWLFCSFVWCGVRTTVRVLKWMVWLLSLLFWPVRWLFRRCCCCCGRQRRHSRTPRAANQCRDWIGRNVECKRERHQLSANNRSPYCHHHHKRNKARRTVAANAFANDKYRWAEPFHSEMRPGANPRTPCDVWMRKLVDEQKAEAHKRPASAREAGWIYIYVAKSDLAHQSIDRDKIDGTNDTFMYKVGMTTRDVATRIAEQDGAVLVSGTRSGVELVDVWRTSDALAAESIAHALLADVRYKRFDSDDARFEIEWFLATLNRCQLAISRAVAFVQ